MLPGLLEANAEASAVTKGGAFVSVRDDVSHGGRCSRNFTSFFLLAPRSSWSRATEAMNWSTSRGACSAL
jgi:hypothetical protein